MRTGRESALVDSGIVVDVVIRGPPFGLEALEWFGDWLQGRLLVFTRIISHLIAIENVF
jgi:hypothetical protein